ncbi:MAG: undecaprenyl/decaprenyl-phosphate alpha-N-acetylglucosaminyl 1-phosphate transferase [Chloroflexi bacterium]|nr:undecaprenyl/decaprenyl-phosphate alpha-N-acetylglucosaminyl 1-phosphate transferase [Chloroflexota bacterium]
MAFFLVFALSFALAFTLAPLTGRLGSRLGIVDMPGGRRRHAGAVSRLGGIALFVAFVIGVLFSRFLPPALSLPMPEGPNPKEPLHVFGILLGSTFLFVVGLWDDRHELGAPTQLIFQIIAALIAIGTEVFIERVTSPFSNQLVVFPWFITAAFTIFWIVGMVNTFNFLDGLDGLAAGVAAITATVLAVHMIREGQYTVSLLPLALLGATLGFLPYNFHPAKVFMGSSGSFFLGYAVATLSIVGGARMATILLVLGVPIMDVAWLIVDRLRRGRSPGLGDRAHLHFRLLDIGISHRVIVLIYWAFCAFFGALALLISSRIYKLIALILLGALTLAVLVLVSRYGGEEDPV